MAYIVRSFVLVIFSATIVTDRMHVCLSTHSTYHTISNLSKPKVILQLKQRLRIALPGQEIAN